VTTTRIEERASSAPVPQPPSVETFAQSERRFRDTFSHAAIGIAHVGLDGRWLLANPKLCAIVGYSEDELRQRTFQDITLPEDLDADLALMRKMLAGELATYTLEKRYVRKDGSRVWINLSVALVRDEACQPQHFVAVIEDISARKQREEEQRRQAELWLETDRRKNDFLAVLAHELRNPLAPIRNALQFMRLKGPVDPDLVRARDMIERQTQQLTNLVDDLLDVTRISRGKVRLKKEIHDITTIINHAVETSRPLIEARKHTLTIAHAPQPMQVEADPARLAQILCNLLNNAAKYTAEGGQIFLTVQREGNEAVVRIEDTGIGIPADMLAWVFELFTQVDHSLARSQGGLGIGLTLVRSLVEMHGGSVEAHSDGPGRGSEFVVRLPILAENPADNPPAAPPASGAPSTRRRVLVVDDNRDAAESLTLLLQLLGHEVRTAFDGETALATAQAWDPEIALLDIGLPGMDGYEVARRLRGGLLRQPCLLVALTGYGREEHRQRSLNAGFDLHFVKPVDSSALRDLLAFPKAPGKEAEQQPVT
jgi:PAS domain S-box-containing protein